MDASWPSQCYLKSKDPCIFLLKLRTFDEPVTETGGEFQILGPWKRIKKCLQIN